jgi:hypothetical protein
MDLPSMTFFQLPFGGFSLIGRSGIVTQNTEAATF